MRGKITALAISLSLILSFSNQDANAQLNLKNLKKKTEKKVEKSVEKRVEKRIDKGIDNSLDKVEESIDESVDGESKDNKSKKPTNDKNNKQNETVNEKSTSEPQSSSRSKSLNVSWSKFDFVQGNEIIFEDNQAGEQNGEFPSKWDLSKGNVENAIVDGENVIAFLKVNANGGGGIVPMIKNNHEDYLPDEFTLEFDAYFPNKNLFYQVSFCDYKNQKKINRVGSSEEFSAEKYLRFSLNKADGKNIEASELDGNLLEKGWRHISISFNKRAIKAYLDETRILNIPNVRFNPTGLTIASHNTEGKNIGYMKNARLAKGAVPLYDKLLTDGKFVTTGIKFDVAKSTIRPESNGTINYVYQMMKEHQDLKFSVEGHTDSDGDDKSNQKLSEARAKAIMDRLIEMGISADRLSFKGLGEAKPIADNNTSEGKAQNRRVEFIKM